MNNLFNQNDTLNILTRLDLLTPDTPRLWGKMNVTQMLAHCSVGMETALDKNRIKRVLIGRIVGTLLKKRVLSQKPFGKNSPTDKTYIFTGRDNLNFLEERSRLVHLINNFFEGGASKCTRYPHPFFGKFTPDEWAIFQWKHLDHHLRQFGV